MLRALFLSLCLVFANKASAVDWQKAIVVTERKAKSLERYAYSKGTSHAGTMYAGWDQRRHECAILGRMVGKEKAIQHLEKMDILDPRTNPDPHDALVMSISLYSWVAAAESALKETHERRVYFWNVNCVGWEKIANSEWVGAKDASISFQRQGNKLLVRGPVENNFYESLKKALDTNPGITTVTLGSGGGNVLNAIRAGHLIRQRGLETELYDNCFSACPLVFMGGTSRTLWASDARLGFHQVSIDGKAVPRDDDIYKLIAAYVDEMKVDSQFVMRAMMSADPRDMFVPEVDKLCEPWIATFIQRRCSNGKLL
ncbi:hypothetical protein [Bosea sp. AAP35]|uniref:COG3904 family protein n=1 Tax=Bosea sp. AAP35 TaxID=1523417 RepID=UPI0006B966D2|nr:hypothetical protein [Bosea sp. AAP35]